MIHAALHAFTNAVKQREIKLAEQERLTTQLSEYAHDYIMDGNMTTPIELRFPNGLIIAMMPEPAIGSRITGGVTKPAETQRELWTRFIVAMQSTDWASVTKVYSSTMPAAAVQLVNTISPRPVPSAVAQTK